MRRVEKLAAHDEQNVRDNAELLLLDEDKELCKSTQHPFVFAKLASFASISGTVRDGSGNVIANVPSLQTLANDNVDCQ
jgi:hypothetical protein